MRRKHTGPAYWTKLIVNASSIQRTTDRAVLFHIAQSAFKDYTFWFPKAMVKQIRDVDEKLLIVIPQVFDVTMQKGDQKYTVTAEFAFSCITNPERHQENVIELERAYREYAGV